MTNGQNSWGVSFGRIMFLDKILRSHGNVSDINREEDIVFEIVRKRQKDKLSVLCCDEYVMGTTAVNRALAEFLDLNMIYVGGSWSGYTRQAKEHCTAHKIGLYNAQEIAGGLWKDEYWDYNRRDEEGNPVFAYKNA